MVLIKLTEEEQSPLQLFFSPTSVASFYRSNSEANETTDVKEYLVERFTQILKTNPWLCGRLVKQHIDGKKNICISYSEDVSDPLTYISTITDDDFFECSQWRFVWEYMSTHLLKKSNKCIDKDELLCKLIIVQNTASSELALIFSLNHSLGDGYTVYRLWKMMGRTQEIIRMEVEREYNFSDYIKRDTNLPSGAFKVTEALKVFGSLIGRAISRHVRRKPLPRMALYKVNSDYVKKIKDEFNKGDQFVSTNDVLTYWLFNNEVCSERDITMLVNLRGRLPEIRSNMAGNYETFCPVNMADVKNPIEFREYWQQVMRKERVVDDTAAGRLRGTNNWSSFYHQIELEGYRHDYHIPIYRIDDLEMRVAGMRCGPERGMVIFRLDGEDLGVILMTYNDMPDDYFETCEILSGKILT